MKINGVIKRIFKSEIVGSNGFEKRDIVITTIEQYAQDIIIQFTQNRCNLLDNFQVGQVVNIDFNLRGREWTNPQGEVKYFNTIEGWKIELYGANNQPQQYAPIPQQPQQPPVYQNPQQPQQTQMFDNNGQAPTNQQGNNQKEDELDLPF